MDRSADAQALLLLFSRLGLPPNSEVAPFTLRDWNPLAGQLPVSDIAQPGDLIGKSADDIAGTFGLPADQAERMALLLDRGGTLAIELDRLATAGVWVLTRVDDAYPSRLRERLGESAPVLLFGSGPQGLPGKAGLAVVGSRDAQETASAAARFVGQACAASDLCVYSGGARGIDGAAMTACLEEGGKVVGVLADSLEKTIRTPEIREFLARDLLTLVTPYSPKAGFSVGAAMGRNKLIYALADYALVVTSEVETGGTWAGATEALKAGYVPVFACTGADFGPGNKMLVDKGAQEFPVPFDQPAATLGTWLESRAQIPRTQRSFF